MLKTHFKRQGSGNMLILQGLPEKYYIEYHLQTGHLKVVEIIQVPKIWNDKTYYETHDNIVLSKNYSGFKNDIIDFSNVQGDINKVTGLNIYIENYIESYYIGAKEGDRDILNNIDITDFTVKEVIEQCNINLVEFFKSWRRETLTEALQNPNEILLNQKFSDLYSFIHWFDIASYKKQIEEFKNVVGL